MSTSFTLHSVAGQIPVLNTPNLTASNLTASNLTASNLTVTKGMTTSDGAFTTTTVVGYAPTNLVGSASHAILPFMKDARSDSQLSSGYILVPAGATITRCTLSNNGVEILPSTAVFRIYTSTLLNSEPDTVPSISLYQGPGASTINGSTALVVEGLAYNSIGTDGNTSVTLVDHSFVQLQVALPVGTLTAGDLRISIQYQTPIVSG